MSAGTPFYSYGVLQTFSHILVRYRLPYPALLLASLVLSFYLILALQKLHYLRTLYYVYIVMFIRGLMYNVCLESAAISSPVYILFFVTKAFPFQQSNFLIQHSSNNTHSNCFCYPWFKPLGLQHSLPCRRTDH